MFSRLHRLRLFPALGEPSESVRSPRKAELRAGGKVPPLSRLLLVELGKKYLNIDGDGNRGVWAWFISVVSSAVDRPRS